MIFDHKMAHMHFTCKATTPHPQLPPLDAGPAPHKVISVVENHLAIAQVGIWHGPSWQNKKTAFIGYPKALYDQVALKVLDEARTQASHLGTELILGPINGSTWFDYRLVTDQGNGQAFALEPWNTQQDLILWQAAGFKPYLTYHSALSTPNIYQTDQRAAELALKFKHIHIRPPHVQSQALGQDVAALHKLSLLAFTQSPLYTPLPASMFEARYLPLLTKIPLDWVWLAEHKGEIIGFLFAYPDPQCGYLILKTLAIHPKRDFAGLGRHLSNLFHQKAFDAGIQGVIHALMWDGNESAALSATRGKVIRRYAVMGQSYA